jgi:hypothetical protein
MSRNRGMGLLIRDIGGPVLQQPGCGNGAGKTGFGIGAELREGTGGARPCALSSIRANRLARSNYCQTPYLL